MKGLLPLASGLTGMLVATTSLCSADEPADLEDARAEILLGLPGGLYQTLLPTRDAWPRTIKICVKERHRPASDPDAHPTGAKAPKESR